MAMQRIRANGNGSPDPTPQPPKPGPGSEPLLVVKDKKTGKHHLVPALGQPIKCGEIEGPITGKGSRPVRVKKFSGTDRFLPVRVKKSSGQDVLFA